MKTKVEWCRGDAWYSVMVQLAFSRNGNWTFKHNGRVYVFRQKKEGEEVLVFTNGSWVKVGRTTRDGVFLGEGLSYGEFCSTPEGMKSAKEALESFLVSRR
jgi:hypothetical protein